jgi:GNAT superfamily N-acetyltransferase
MGIVGSHDLTPPLDLAIVPLRKKDLGQLAYHIGRSQGVTNYYPRWRAHHAGRVDVLLAHQERIVGQVEVDWAPMINSAFQETPIPAICNLFIVSERRHQGIGRALMVAAEEMAIARGTRQIGLSVSPAPSAAAARHLYADLGYHPFTQPGLGDDGIWMDGMRYLVKALPDGPLHFPSELTISHLLHWDAQRLAQAFAAQGKPLEQFAAYREEEYRHERLMLIARRHDDVGAIAGYATLRWQPWYEGFRSQGIPELVDLNTLPAWQRRGVGAALVGACEHTVATRGFRRMGISVEHSRAYAGAERLYRRLGYAPDGLGVSPVDNELHLVKELTL